MIPVIITALTSLVAGVLVGGCARPDNEVTKAMIHRKKGYTTRRQALAVREWNIAAGRLVSDPTEIVVGIEAAFPRPDRMDRYYSFHINLFQITAPERLQSELVALSDQHDIIRARREAAEQARRQITQGLYCTGRTARKPKLLLV